MTINQSHFTRITALIAITLMGLLAASTVAQENRQPPIGDIDWPERISKIGDVNIFDPAKRSGDLDVGSSQRTAGQSSDDITENLRVEVERLRETVAELQLRVPERAVDPADLEPPPANPTDLLFERTVERGAFRGAFRIPNTDVSLRIGGFVKADVGYDTGFVGTGIRVFPSTIGLDGTAESRRAGRTLFTARQSQLSFDAQSPNSKIGRLRGYLELDFFGNDARVRHLYGEWENLLGGQTWSAFMDPAALPQTVFETAAAGGIFRRQPQFRLTSQSFHGVTAAVSIEQPVTTDFAIPDPANSVRLERWPDLVAQLRKADQSWGSLQTAVMVRGIGFENLARDEQIRTGWGVSTTARINTYGNDNLRVGFVGGRGIGSYLVGSTTDLAAAAPVGGAFRTLQNIGAFAGYQHFWSEEWGSNVGYGYSQVETSNDLPATAGRTAQNGWINLIWFPRPNFGVGIEYNYAMREVRDGTTGDNNRIHFTIQFGP